MLLLAVTILIPQGATAGVVPVPGAGSTPFDDEVAGLVPEEVPGLEDVPPIGVPPTGGLVPDPEGLLGEAKNDFEDGAQLRCAPYWGDGTSDDLTEERLDDGSIVVRVVPGVDCFGLSVWDDSDSPPVVNIGITGMAVWCATSCLPPYTAENPCLADVSIVPCKRLGLFHNRNNPTPFWGDGPGEAEWRLFCEAGGVEPVGLACAFTERFMADEYSSVGYNYYLDRYTAPCGSECHAAGQIWVVSWTQARMRMDQGWTLTPKDCDPSGETRSYVVGTCESCTWVVDGAEYVVDCYARKVYRVGAYVKPDSGGGDDPPTRPGVQETVRRVCEDHANQLPQCRDLHVDVIHG